MNHLLLGLALAVSIWVPSAVHAAPVLTVASAHVRDGETFDIALAISGVDAASGLGAWQFDLRYDPAVVHANSVSEGPFMAAFGSTLFGGGVIDDATGLVSLVTDAFVDLPPWPTGEGVLAIISFTAVANGHSALTLGNTVLDFFDTGAGTQDGWVLVGPRAVPEPGTAPLAALAVLLAVTTTVRPRLTRSQHSHQPEGTTP